MKSLLLILIATSACLFACTNTSKTETASSTEATIALSNLKGIWKLSFVAPGAKPLDSIYPEIKPELEIEDSLKFRGFTSCNGFNGSFTLDSNRISFPASMAMTRMVCQGEGERIFLEALHKTTSFSISTDTVLSFKTGDTILLRFTHTPAIVE